MQFARPLLLVSLCIALSGCGFGQSKLNPFNWFGKSAPRETIVLPDETADGRGLVEAVLTMSVEPMPGGAIVRARGQNPRQGYWRAELVPLDIDADGTLVYEFRLLPPITQTDVNTPQSRQVDAAIFISDYKLANIREIVVQGATNARVSQR